MAKLSAIEKKNKLFEILEVEKKIAEKSGEELQIGVLKDFKISNRENYFLTGILGIDSNTNGFKKGTFNVLYGAESSGKSTIALEAVSAYQQTNPESYVLYVDTEQTVDDVFLDRIPGINKEKIIFFKDIRMEHIFDKIDELTKAGVIDFIVLDSIDTMIPMKEEEKSLEDRVMMDKAMILSRAMAKINVTMAQKGITVLMIQQLRVNFTGMIAKTNGRSGGNAAKFYPATVNFLSKQKAQNDTEKDDIEGQKVVNQFCKITNEKSKISEPYKETYTFLNTDRSKKNGVAKMRELFHYATVYGLIETKGAWCYYTDLDTGEIIKVNGKAQMLNLLAKDIDLFSKLKFMIYGKILPPELLIVKFDEIKTLIEKENALIKKNKIDILTVQNRKDLISENDLSILSLQNKDILDIISKEEYELGLFNLKSDEEKEEYLKQKNEEDKKQKLKNLEIELVETKTEE